MPVILVSGMWSQQTDLTCQPQLKRQLQMQHRQWRTAAGIIAIAPALGPAGGGGAGGGSSGFQAAGLRAQVVLRLRDGWQAALGGGGGGSVPRAGRPAVVALPAPPAPASPHPAPTRDAVVTAAVLGACPAPVAALLQSSAVKPRTLSPMACVEQISAHLSVISPLPYFPKRHCKTDRYVSV